MKSGKQLNDAVSGYLKNKNFWNETEILNIKCLIHKLKNKRDITNFDTKRGDPIGHINV